MNERLLKWIWLTTLGLRPSRLIILNDRFDSIEEIYKADKEEYSKIDDLSKADISLLLNKDTSKAKMILEKLKAIDAYAIDYDDEMYPDRLRQLPNPPYVLYIRGTLPKDDEIITLGVVGTRKYSDYGELVTKKMSYSLAKAGFTIVSGMARGIDTFSAIAALRAGAKTVAVLGCGVDVVYPPENTEVMKAIIENGAVISEYPPTTPPLPAHFPERNRIIAGLSDAVLVTEAPAKSGALITARSAYEIGRKIFAVPGNVFKENSVGTNNLIKAGVYPATYPNDIIDEFSLELKNFKKDLKEEGIIVNYPLKKQKRKKTLNETIEKFEKSNTEVNEENKTDETSKTYSISIEDERFSDLTEDEKTIVKIIIEKNQVSVDELIRSSSLSASTVNSLLSFMEISGEVKRLPGNYYQINNII